MWTRRRAITGIACLGGASLTAAIPAVKRATGVLDTRGWPSLMDALPGRIQSEVRAGRYQGDLSQALRDAIETGADFIIPEGSFLFAGGILEIRTPGQRIVGTGGVLRRLALRDGIGLLISAPNVMLDSVTLDGHAPVSQPSHHNDMVKVAGSGCTLNHLVVNGAWGSNLRLDRVQHCRVIRPILTQAHQNNLIICNGSTDDITVDHPVCRGATTQNNIFVTASEGSQDNGEFVSRIVITDPLCSDAGDTGIELGYHCQDCSVTGGKIVNSTNPALLQRDGRRNLWKNVVVETKPLSRQIATYDAVAVVPQWEPATWDSNTEFNAITIRGRTTRSAFYWGQSGIRRIDCHASAFAPRQDRVADGYPTVEADHVGSGDLKAGDVNNIVVRGGMIDGFAIGDNWNYDGGRHQRIGCITEDVVFTRCTQVFNLYNVIPIRSRIMRNTGSGNLRSEISLVGAHLVPSDEHPYAGLVYDDNSFTAAKGFPPLGFTLPENGRARDALLLSKDSRFMKIPVSGAVAVSTSPAKAGRYQLFMEGAPVAFSVALGPNGPVLRESTQLASPNGTTIEVTVENSRLVLHQRAKTPKPLWVKISGPGIQAGPIA